jgi:hypothetical protein
MIIEALALILATQSAPAAAPAPVSDSSYCTPGRKIAYRAWSMFIAKNSISSEQAVDFGARLQGLGALMAPCGEVGQDKPQVDLSPLTGPEIETLQKFGPQGGTAAWAECLSKAANESALAFLESSDRWAYANYAASKKIGGFDDPGFKKLISTNACKDSIQSNINSTNFYSDLNWYVRVLPRMTAIIEWHKGNTNA